MTTPRLPFWSQITLPGALKVLVVDGSLNAEGWEAEVCHRVFNVLQRKGVGLATTAPLVVDNPEDLAQTVHRHDNANCILLFCHGADEGIPVESTLDAFWAQLSTDGLLPPKAFAVCTWGTPDEDTARSILQAEDRFAQLAVVPRSPLSPRAGGLFFMKLLTELDLHSEDSITGKMMWFSSAKAREILKRRGLPGDIGVRC